jgi:hypothetical protein
VKLVNISLNIIDVKLELNRDKRTSMPPAVVADAVAAVPLIVPRTMAGGAGVAVGLHHSMMRQSARNDYVILANLGNM